MADQHLLHAYLATTWRVRLPTGTLAVKIGERTRLSDTGIVTAFNPASIPHDHHRNRAANRRLLDELRSAGGRVHAAVALGHGPDAARWREPGFAVSGIPLDTLVRIAGRFRQNAIVWIPESGIPLLVVTRAGFAGRDMGEQLHR